MAANRYLRIAAAAFAAITFGLLARMMQCLWLSVNNVPVRDQWFMLDELIRFHQGKIHLNYLWTPYWGQRIVIPRLLFLMDKGVFHFSNPPLIVINVAAQLVACALLIAVSHRALRDQSRAVQWLSAIAIAGLCFSSLQMENFVYGMAVQYMLGCASAIAAIVLMANGAASRRNAAFALAAALFSALTWAAGVLLWPMLIAEAFLTGTSQKKTRWTAGLFSAIFCLLAVAYSIDFTNVGGGMGIAGLVRRPLQAIWVASMVLGGPLSVFRPWLGQLAGLFGIAATLYLWTLLLRRGVGVPRSRVALASIAAFFVLVAFSIVAGRMTPEFVASFHGVAPVPSRYFTFCFLFWAALLPAALANRTATLLDRIVRVVTILIVAGLTLGTAAWQFQESLDWVSFTRHLDAAASSFFVTADDPLHTAIIFPDQQGIDRWTPYLRERRLAVFHESRATWIGQPVSTLIGTAPIQMCQASLDPPAANGRITGTIPASITARYGGTNLVFTGPDGRIAGTGLTTFDSHRPFPPAAYPFLGYVRTPVPAPLTAWSLGPRICRF